MSEKRSLRPLQRTRRAAPQPFHGAKPPTNRDLMSRDGAQRPSLNPAPIIAALLLVLLAAQFGDPEAWGVVPAGVVVELTHLATLYHDDVMDEARRAIRLGHARRALALLDAELSR